MISAAGWRYTHGRLADQVLKPQQDDTGWPDWPHAFGAGGWPLRGHSGTTYIRSDIYLKDEASIGRFRELFAGRQPKMEASGATILYALVNDEDPLHLMYLERWQTREHFAAYMDWALAQPESAEFGGLFSRAPEHIWLREQD